MATTTQYFNLNISEGSDIVNPLTDIFPNFSSLDGILNNIGLRLLTNATHTKTGTVHNITRQRLNGNVTYPTAFRFNATANWKNGDTMTLNGASVTVITTNGEVPGDDVFVAGSDVIGIVTSGVVTLCLSNKNFPTASEVTTTDGDSVQDYIDNTKFKNLETWTPNIGENWETFLARIRDNSTKTIPANFIRCTVDGVSGLIFRQSRRTSATSWQYETDYFTGNSLIKYAMSVGSDSAVLRKYDILNGTVQNLSSADAQIINIYGLDV